MANCTSALGANTTSLDNIGLDRLQLYMSAIPLTVQNSALAIMGNVGIGVALLIDPAAHITHTNLAPTLQSYDNMYGLVAQTLAELATAGYYGAAEVPISGSISRPAYLVRGYILALLLVMLVANPLFAVLLLLSNRVRRIPLHRATFLTVANAVRGPWWDALLRGGCVMPDDQLGERYRGVEVMYGVDVNMPHHVGLGQVVAPVRPDGLYAGVPVKRDGFRMMEE